MALQEFEIAAISTPASDGIALTVFTNSGRKPLAKIFTKAKDGTLAKKTAAQMVEGSFVVRHVADLDEFLDLLDAREYGPDSAICYGVPEMSSGRITTRDTITEGKARPGAISRTAEYFSFPEAAPGILMLDVDPPADRPDWGRAEIDGSLCRLLPWWRTLRRGWIASSSGEIYDIKTGEKLSPANSLRCYIAVDDASQIKAIGEAIFIALFDAGEGYVGHAKNGRRLLRTAIDRMVWQPERLDFPFGAVLGPGLRQDRVTHRMGHVPMLETAGKGCIDYDEWRRTSSIACELWEAARDTAKEMETVWIETEVEKAVQRGVAPERARQVYASASRGELAGEVVLTTGDGSIVTVDELLANPKAWHHRTFADPLEPGYAGGSAVAIAYIAGQKAYPTIFTQAHGGGTYRLVPSEKPRKALPTIGDGMIIITDSDDEAAELVKIFPQHAVIGGGAPEDWDWSELNGRAVIFWPSERGADYIRAVHEGAEPGEAYRLNEEWLAANPGLDAETAAAALAEWQDARAAYHSYRPQAPSEQNVADALAMVQEFNGLPDRKRLARRPEMLRQAELKLLAALAASGGDDHREAMRVLKAHCGRTWNDIEREIRALRARADVEAAQEQETLLQRLRRCILRDYAETEATFIGAPGGAESSAVTVEDAPAHAPACSIYWPDLTEADEPNLRSYRNAEAFMRAHGIEPRYNIFEGMPVLGGKRFDQVALGILFKRCHRAGYLVDQRFLSSCVEAYSYERVYHPVCEYLDSLTWDGEPRIHTWLTTYAGVEDTELNRAIGSTVLIGAVRMVRKPGSKFDGILTLIGEAQGESKGKLIRTMARRLEWWGVGFPLGADDKVVMERTAGKWICEFGEFARGKRAIENMKDCASRQTFNARMAYAPRASQMKRQFIVIATTNEDTPLEDTTGNRRFWPVRVGKIDIDALEHDMDQLWAEAAAREAEYEGDVNLPEHLWKVAGEQQEDARSKSRVEMRLHELLEKFRGGRIRVTDVYRALELRENPPKPVRDDVSRFMQRMGWGKAKQVRIGDERPYCFEKIAEDGAADVIICKTPPHEPPYLIHADKATPSQPRFSAMEYEERPF